MNDELSRQAQELLAAGREADLPRASDRSRVRAKLALQLAAATAAAGAGKAAAQTTATAGKLGALTLNGKLALAAAALGVLGAAAAMTPRRADPLAQDAAPIRRAQRPPVAAEAPATSEASPRMPTGPSAAPGRRDASEQPPAATRPEAERSHAPVEAQDWAADLQAEVQLLALAQRALAAGQTAAALGHLAEHRARFPRGALSQERTAATAVAHCQAGRAARGRALLTRLPDDSPLSGRARHACGLEPR